MTTIVRMDPLLTIECEQRHRERLLVKDNVFAALGGGLSKVGKIDDISLKGLGFSYLNPTGATRPLFRAYHIDIFLPQKGFHLFNLPCKTVHVTTGVTIVEGDPVKLSRCGVHFGKLSDIQLNLLNFLISKFTVKNRPREKRR